MQRIVGCPGVTFSGAPTYFWCILLRFNLEGSCPCVFYFMNTYNFLIWEKMTVWGCDNDRQYSDRYVIKLQISKWD